ncbi:MAG: hypothetical protein WAM73_13690, partial [Desulfobacterales bacterium]
PKGGPFSPDKIKGFTDKRKFFIGLSVREEMISTQCDFQYTREKAVVSYANDRYHSQNLYLKAHRSCNFFRLMCGSIFIMTVASKHLLPEANDKKTVPAPVRAVTGKRPAFPGDGRRCAGQCHVTGYSRSLS